VKKILAIVLSSILLISLIGCSSSKPNEKQSMDQQMKDNPQMKNDPQMKDH